MMLVWNIVGVAAGVLVLALWCYLAYRAERPARPIAAAPPAWQPSLPSLAGQEVELWGVVTCCRCLTEHCHPASREWSLYAHERPYAQFAARLKNIGWQKIGIGIEPSRWHCPDCVESIKSVVYQ